MEAADAQAWLGAAWAECFSAVVESATGQNPSLAAAADAFPADSGELAWSQPFSLGADYGVTVSFASSSWTVLGEAALAALGVEANDSDAVRGTFLELVNQAMEALAGRIGTHLGREVTCQAGRTELMAGASLRALRGELSGVAIEHGLGGSGPLLSMLSSDGGRASGRGNGAFEETDSNRTLDLLLDVELPVSVSFGRARVALKDVLKLTSGSIVELNRTVSDPVEVIVNNCVIARGEVVVVDGNYGIRIQEILSRQERLRTLN